MIFLLKPTTLTLFLNLLHWKRKSYFLTTGHTSQLIVQQLPPLPCTRPMKTSFLLLIRYVHHDHTASKSAPVWLRLFLSVNELLWRLRPLLLATNSVSHSPLQSDEVETHWLATESEGSGPLEGCHWFLSNATKKDESNRNDSCHFNQSPSPGL